MVAVACSTRAISRSRLSTGKRETDGFWVETNFLISWLVDRRAVACCVRVMSDLHSGETVLSDVENERNCHADSFIGGSV